MTRAYVLITTEVGKADDVAQAFKHLTGVKSAEIVAGTYDVVVVLEGPDTNAIGRLVLNHLHGTPGLKGTVTLVVIG
jgi:uncharacterized protein with GYD domain